MTSLFRSICLKVSVVASFLLIFQVSHAQRMDTAALGDVVAQQVRMLKENNVTLAVGNKDTLIYKNDTKQFNITRGQGEAGYISQWYATALILMLADEGKFSLDDKVAQYLPAFSKYGKGFITIRHCLSMNTGIQTSSKTFEKLKGESLVDEANSYAAKEIQTNPGTEARFNDRGLIIAAAIVEIVTKKKFEMLASQRLFRPMGMRNTTFSTADGTLSNPNFGARTTSADLVIFGRMLLNSGKANGIQVLKPESVAEMRKITAQADNIINAPKEFAFMDYASGSWVLESNGGSATAMAAPSLLGSSAVIDFCRGYVFAYVVKEVIKEKKGDPMRDIKAALDGGREIKCQ